MIRSFGFRDTATRLPNTFLCLFAWWIAVLFLRSVVPIPAVYGFGWFLLSVTAVFLLWDFGSRLLDDLKIRPFLRIARKLPHEMKEVCDALNRLAGRRTGALVVLERRESLGKFIQRGTCFDSEIKAELLISLFHTSSPLHDGAVVISKNRIRAARVILPLTLRPDVPMGIGTRHRSAIGITEKTDAVALVVSEERGAISIAYRGRLLKTDSEEDLLKLLDRALRRKEIGFETKKDFLKGRRS